MSKIKDLTGMHFGELTVIGISQKRGKNGDVFGIVNAVVEKKKKFALII